MDLCRQPLSECFVYMHIVSYGTVYRIASRRLRRLGLELLDNPWDIDRRPCR